MKSSLIFTKLLQLVSRGTLSSELFKFLRYLYQDIQNFHFSIFLTVCTKCYYRLDTAVVNRKNLKHSWEKLPIINQLPNTVSSVFEVCVKCTNICNVPVPPVLSEDTTSCCSSSDKFEVPLLNNGEDDKLSHLRHNLEQARVLCDQVRKREVLKRQLVCASIDANKLELNLASDQACSPEGNSQQGCVFVYTNLLYSCLNPAKPEALFCLRFS